MKRLKRGLLGLLTMLALFITINGMDVQAAGGSCGAKATWSYDTSTRALTISGTGTVTSHPWLDSYKTAIKTVTVGNGITELEGYSFQNCSALSQVNLPSSLKEINVGVFQGCTSLRSIKLPAGLTDIGWDAFSGCANLKSVTIPKTVTDATLAFRNSGVTSVTFEAGMKKIPGYVLADCEQLTNVVIPSGVTDIGVGAFSRCTSLKSIKLPAGLQGIGWDAFEFCTGLTTVTVPKTVTDALLAFRKSSVTTVTLENGMTTIDSFMFSGAKQLHTINIPTSVTRIKMKAFEDCTALKTIRIPGSVTEIEDDSFKESALTTIYGVYSSTAQTYAQKHGYKFVANGKPMSYLSVSQVGLQKHTGKAIAPTVTVKDGTKVLRAGTNYQISYRNNVNIGTATITITGIDGYYSGSKSITFKIAAKKGKTYASGNLKYKVLKDSTNGKGTVSVAGLNKSVKSVTIPKTVSLGGIRYKVTAIEKKAFYKKSKLKKIKIKSTTITKIGAKAFSGISTKAKITVPKSKKSRYKKMLKNSGINSKVTIK